MFTDKLLRRTVWPTLLVAFILLTVCITTAVWLFREQVRSAEILREDIESRRIAYELESTIDNLSLLLSSGTTKVDEVNDSINDLLSQAHDCSNKPEECRLMQRVRECFLKYHHYWEDAGRDGPMTEQEILAAVVMLEGEVLPVCHDLRDFEANQIEKSDKFHRQRVAWLARGLIAVGCIGSLVGVCLGYVVSRELRQSIYQLSVRIRDAADQLGETLPAVTLVKDGDFDRLDAQIQRLMREVENVVRQLQQREREVLRADQLCAVGQLAAGAAHELRNPLTAIKMLVQTSREEACQRGLPTEDLRVIEGEVRRMERCLHTFLDFARLPNPERRLFDLAGLVERTFSLVEGRARRQEVRLDFTPPLEPILLEADPEQVQQVLVNLLLNSLDAMPQGGSIDVECHADDEEMRLYVRDTGPGLAPEILPRLFEPFASTKETGLGMGLVVSRRIAQAHDGQLRAVNPVGGGAEFELRLPLVQRAEPVDGSVKAGVSR